MPKASNPESRNQRVTSRWRTSTYTCNTLCASCFILKSLSLVPPVSCFILKSLSLVSPVLFWSPCFLCLLFSVLFWSYCLLCLLFPVFILKSLSLVSPVLFWSPARLEQHHLRGIASSVGGTYIHPESKCLSLFPSEFDHSVAWCLSVGHQLCVLGSSCVGVLCHFLLCLFSPVL